MTLFLDVLGSSIVCPAAVLYVYLLNDRWRVTPVWRWLFLAICGPLSLLLTNYCMAFLPMVLRIWGIWGLMLVFCFAFSAIRDGRIFFVITTGMLFSYVCTVTSSMLAIVIPVHRCLLRIALNALFLILGLRVFRPAFWETYRVLTKGWLAFTLMPASLLGIFFSLLAGTNYNERYDFPYVRTFTYALVLLSVVLYCASFFFFRRLGRWQRQELGSAILSSQISARDLQLRRKQQSDERGRILRHDLRHYLRILSSCLRDGDRHIALQALDALSRHIQSARDTGEEGPP